MGRIIVVGGGVLGTMHAVAARRRGFEVVQLEREAEARGASVRNFGLVWVSGRRPGAEVALALRARALWQELSADVPGIGFRPDGSVTLAMDDAELQVLKEAAELPDAAARRFELLDADGVRAVNPALRGEFAGGLWCRADAVVEPRLAQPALRRYLAGLGGYEWLPGREVTEFAPNAIRDHTGGWHRGDLVVLCTGAALTGLTASHLARLGSPAAGTGAGSPPAAGTWAPPPATGTGAPLVRRVRLQMMQTRPFGTKVTTALADGDSLRYYPAYDVPGRGQLGPQVPVAARHRMQLLLVQRADGGLTIGDTHEYDEPFAFDVDEDAYQHLRVRAEALLGGPVPPVQRRWAGVYSEVTGGDALYHRSQVAPGVILVTGPGGRGMTCSPAIAEETFR
jgi:glycine/D-amino acid oxidase-like deaminating enzyme